MGVRVRGLEEGVLTKHRILQLVLQKLKFLLFSLLLFASRDELVSRFSIKSTILSNVITKHERLCPCW